MTCEEFENLMVIQICGKLTNQEKEGLTNHLSTCSGCAARYGKINELQNSGEQSQIPQPDWEKSWEIIAEKSIRERFSPRNTRNMRKIFNFKFKPFNRKYILAAASLILVFIIGFTIGRKFFVLPQITSSRSSSELSLQNFAEDLEPVLIDFLNRDDRPSSRKFDQFEKKLVTDLLAKTRLLKYIMQKRKNQELVQLFNDIEFILLNVSNLRPGDTSATKQIQQFIREKKLKFQLKLVANEKVKI